MKFPVEAPQRRVSAAFKKLGFELVRSGNHLALVRKNAVGTINPMTIPNHPHLKSSTLSGHNGGVTSVVFSHDGQILATASMDYTIRLWRAPRGERDRLQPKTKP